MLVAAAILSSATASAVKAQTAGQITPPSFRPPVESAPGSITIPEAAGPEAPAGADKLTLRIGRIAVEGALPALADETRRILEPLQGRTVSVADLFAAARTLEQAYAAAGYVLARVVLPAQRLSDGAPVRLTVVDGFIERVDTSQLPNTIRSRIDALLASLVGLHGLTLDRIERRLSLAGDTPGTALRSTLAAGEAPGASVLVIEARYRLVTGFLSFDNTLASPLGRYTAGLGLNLNSALGLGELFYLRASGYPDDGSTGFQSGTPRNRALAGGVTVPLGTDGFTVNVEVTDARTTPVAPDGTAAFASDFNRYSVRLRYPVLRSRETTVATELDFDAQEERLTALTPFLAPLSLDRLRILRPTVDGVAILPWDGVVTGRLVASFGLDALGARTPADASAIETLSRQGSRPDFQKLELALGYNQPLFQTLVADLQAHGQAAFGQALPLSEQIGLATSTGLSSFDTGLFQGDTGYVVRGELQAPLPFAVSGGSVALAPYAFGAYGAVYLNQPTALEAGTSRGKSYGLGMRAGAAQDASFTNFSVTLEYGRRERSNGGGSGDRVTLTALLNF